MVEISTLLIRSTIDFTLPIRISVLLEATLTRLDFELRIYITSTEIIRIVRDKTCIYKVRGSFCCGSLIDVNQAEIRCLILHFHELDNAFSRVCKAFLTLHDAFQFFLLLLDRLCHVALVAILFLL